MLVESWVNINLRGFGPLFNLRDKMKIETIKVKNKSGKTIIVNAYDAAKYKVEPIKSKPQPKKETKIKSIEKDK